MNPITMVAMLTVEEAQALKMVNITPSSTHWSVTRLHIFNSLITIQTHNWRIFVSFFDMGFTHFISLKSDWSDFVD